MKKLICNVFDDNDFEDRPRETVSMSSCRGWSRIRFNVVKMSSCRGWCKIALYAAKF